MNFVKLYQKSLKHHLIIDRINVWESKLDKLINWQILLDFDLQFAIFLVLKESVSEGKKIINKSAVRKKRTVFVLNYNDLKQ